MHINLEGSLFLLMGVVMAGLYVSRERGLRRLGPEVVPEVDGDTFSRLRELLQTAYQRTLYLGVAFFYLAFVSLCNRSQQARWFGLILAAFLFFYNIPPRNRIMKILTEAGLDRGELARRGINL